MPHSVTPALKEQNAQIRIAVLR